MTEMGMRFQPGLQDEGNGLLRGGDGGPRKTVPQQAIRTLSLRVPQTQSVPGIAPLPLLTAMGGGGSDLDMLVTALLKTFGPGAMRGASGLLPGSQSAGGPSMSSPSHTAQPRPRIVVGSTAPFNPSPVVEAPPSGGGPMSAPGGSQPRRSSVLAEKYERLPETLTPLF